MGYPTMTATFHGATRAGHSKNGNPTWVMYTSEGAYRTGIDSQLGFAIPNYLKDGTDSLVDHTVVLTFSGQRVIDMEAA